MPKASLKRDNDDEESDVEMEGVDLDDDNGADAVAADDDSMAVDIHTTVPNDNDDDDNAEEQDEEKKALLQKEAAELEAARKERQELLQAAVASAPPNANTTPQSKMDFLMQQSDVFAQFLAGSVAAGETNNPKKRKKAGGRGGGRMTEAEEDARMLKTANSKLRVVRVERQPKCLAAPCKMHPYQLEGLNWLIKIHDHGINGILADEMGLGKTLQTISMLAYLRETRGVQGPHITIVPKSVVGNWMRELHMWCPSIRAVRMGGTKDERKHFVSNYLDKSKTGGKIKFDVLVTSYEGFLREKSKLAKVAWQYLIIDEAHRIKDPNSSLSQAVRLVQTQFRLLITGTPLQNNLKELWALLNFIMPDVFGDEDYFNQWFSLSDESGKENVIKKLHTVLRPFMLRRVKKDVATSLPPKKETKLYVGLTDMQQQWYVRCLQKDAHELNKLGGPDRNRLMNVLMQLRKVCNHPYLFDGAEPGPPYTDGPHIWENSGKMLLLHKLLLKLKENDSRVLIFSQMTRVLDILEDYMRYLNYEYCRIDGNTDGEKRDSQMEEFNSEGSSKFVFLLSTRAGGLGINLATANIVVLFDSDFNPQVDLQAMDRAHRLGQKKPVQVFRFVTEGTVEEKIIERADRKLFLDAAVIQQGRLAEQHSAMEKGELMKMVRFGADQILSGKGGTYSDQDIDNLIAQGEAKTTEMQAKLKTDAQHDLANFSLLADDPIDSFSFGGTNYRGNEQGPALPGNFINLPQRQRKKLYDTSSTEPTSGAAVKKDTYIKKKGPSLRDFQLFDIERLQQLHNKEMAIASDREKEQTEIAKLRREAASAPLFGTGVAQGRSREELTQQAEAREQQLASFHLSAEDTTERESIHAEGFPDWNRKDFRIFCAALERFGRYDFNGVCNDIMNETAKERPEIQRYFVAFWTNYQRIAEWEKILEKIEKGEKKIVRLRIIRDTIQEKVETHLYDTFASFYHDGSKPAPTLSELVHASWKTMSISYGNSSKGSRYQEEEDAFLVCMMYKHGYGASERIRMEIRRAWQFRFNWWLKSRTAPEIQKRCEMLVRVVEREMEEAAKKEAKLMGTVGPSTPTKLPTSRGSNE